MNTPSTNQLLNLARELRAKCKEHQWDDLRRQIDALIELESRDHLIAGLDMIQTAYDCRLEALISKRSDMIDEMDKKLSKLYQDADIHGHNSKELKAAFRTAAQKVRLPEMWDDLHADFPVTHPSAKALKESFGKRHFLLLSELARFTTEHVKATATSTPPAPPVPAIPSSQLKANLGKPPQVPASLPPAAQCHHEVLPQTAERTAPASQPTSPQLPSKELHHLVALWLSEFGLHPLDLSPRSRSSLFPPDSPWIAPQQAPSSAATPASSRMPAPAYIIQHASRATVPPPQSAHHTSRADYRNGAPLCQSVELMAMRTIATLLADLITTPPNP